MGINRFILFFSHDFPPSSLGHSRQEFFYQQQIKPLIQLLYARSDWNCCLALNAEISQWLLSYHPEALTALLEMSHRKQLEILGGPFNDAFLPMLTNSNRLEQLESLSVWIRSTFGRKPRGSYIPHGIWEPNLAHTLASCDIEFTFVPRKLFITADCIDPSSPHIVEEGGRSIFVIPYHSLNEEKNPEEELQFLLSLPSRNDSILGLSFRHGRTSWLEKIMNMLYANGARFDLPTLYFKKLPTTHVFPLIYLPASDGSALQSSDSFYRNAILRKREARWLYARVMYSTLMARQIKNDKSRKKIATQSISKVQNHQFYWHSYWGGIAHPQLREFAYSELLASDQLVRDSKAITYGLIRTDFDYDGLQESLYHTPLYLAMNHQRGGIMFELSLFSIEKNLFNIYAQDSSHDNIQRGFHDLFLPREATYDEWATNTVDRGIFESSYYELKESKSDPASLLYICELPIQETLLEIKKFYLYKMGEFQVSYRLFNNALGAIDKIFGVELNLSSTKGYEYILSGEKQSADQEIQAISNFTILESSTGCALEIELSAPATIWAKKLYNEVLMERDPVPKQIYQGHSFLIFWPFALHSTNSQHYNITVRPLAPEN